MELIAGVLIGLLTPWLTLYVVWLLTENRYEFIQWIAFVVLKRGMYK